MTAPSGGPARVLVLADSLAFHGPERAELLTESGLYPNVLARELGARVDVVARMGWTARDAWWAMTRDPGVYSVLLPRAAAVVLAVGGMDYLPAVLPTYLREGIAYLRPAPLRRAARSAYRRCQPVGARLTRGRWRTLPQRLTDLYLSRCVYGVRTLHPGVPVIGVLPPPHDAPFYGRVTAGHRPAVAAARAWGAREGVPMVDLPGIVAPRLAAGAGNPDGMHWDWPTHAEVGAAVAAAVRAAWTATAPADTGPPPESAVGGNEAATRGNMDT
ncbi:MAG TPA: diglucosylglycerate octanoyltransferase [Mycobacteriales bacterium]|nr:diglucosylglycerate octanoyltransferase [Mycobacteriales bacterium]